MRSRTGVLFWCVLSWFVCSSTGVCQTHQAAPINRLFSADSLKTQAATAQEPFRPIRIDSAAIQRARSQFENQPMVVTFKNAPQAEPWARFHLSGTQWEWNIRRAGDYAAQTIVGSIEGNVDIIINFSGFEDLHCSNPHTPTVETYYGASIGSRRVEEVDWANASDFNKRTLLIRQDPDSMEPVSWGLWNRVRVRSDHSAAEYSDDVVITFAMQNMSLWTDPELPAGR
jgi:hypothetical protein